MKKWFITFFLAYTFVHAVKQSQTVFLSRHFGSAQQAQQTLSKQAHFLFDIHGVLFDNKGKYVKAFKKIHHKKKFFKQGVKALLSKKTRTEYRRLQREGNKITERKFGAAKDFKYLHNELIDFSNAIFTPNKQMYTLLTDLKSRGHDLYLCSNIGNVTLERLVAQHPQFFTVMNAPHNTINRTASETGNFVWKPQAAAYKQALATVHKSDAAHLCIFVDDHIQNVTAAHKAGLNAIHFTSYPQFFHDVTTLLKL